MITVTVTVTIDDTNEPRPNGGSGDLAEIIKRNVRDAINAGMVDHRFGVKPPRPRRD